MTFQPVCRDAAETYLPAFEACVRQGGVSSIMCSYNAVCLLSAGMCWDNIGNLCIAMPDDTSCLPSDEAFAHM